MKDRKISRMNKKREKEERLGIKTEFGISDPTAQQAVDLVIMKERQR